MKSATQLLNSRENEKTIPVTVSIPIGLLETIDGTVVDLRKQYPSMSRSSFTSTALQYYIYALGEEVN